MYFCLDQLLPAYSRQACCFSASPNLPAGRGGTGRGEPGAGLPTTHSLWLRLRMGLNVTSSWWVNPFAKVLWSAIQWPNDCSWTEQWSLIRFIVSSYFWANKVPQLKARWFSYFSCYSPHHQSNEEMQFDASSRNLTLSPMQCVTVKQLQPIYSVFSIVYRIVQDNTV